MRNLYLLFLLFVGTLCFAQKHELKPEPCGTDLLMSNLLEDNPEARERISHIEDLLRSKGKNLKKSAFEVITIPVVVYVVHGGNTSPENISDSQVIGQIVALNNYFDPYNIKFCLATKSNGSPIPVKNTSTDVQTTPGIIHVNNPAATNHFGNTLGISDLTATAHPSITKKQYLRIWVVKSIDGSNSPIKGYSTLPFLRGIEGVVMESDIFGDASQCPGCNLDPENNQGKILVHEIGHYLGLYHTFHGSCSGMNATTCDNEGDYVCDTPPVANPNYYCVLGTNSCNEVPDLSDKIHNFMDYGPGVCAYEFTEGQKVRMHDMIALARYELVSNENLIYTGVCGYEQLITAKFETNYSAPCINSNVIFTSVQQTGTSFLWDFGDGSASTSANPTHSYTSSSGSPYTVTLTVTKDGKNATSTELIFVTDCFPVQNSNTYWYLGDSYGLNFATGVPVFDSAFPTTSRAYRCASLLNDNNGNLIFYNNGEKVWNKNHVQISTSPIHDDSVNGGGKYTLVLPKPGDATKNYIFSVGTDSFRYHVVNVNAGNATMGVVRQPVTIPSGSSYLAALDGALNASSLAAIKNCDGYWILAILSKATQEFLVVYSLSSATTNDLSFVSEYGIPGSVHDYHGIEVSPNGNKIALLSGNSTMSVYKSYLFDFDKVAAVVSSPVEILVDRFNSNSIWGVHGGTFSPDSQLLYLANNTANAIVQYNINTGKINESRIDVGTKSPFAVFRNIQLGPDNKIYIARDDIQQQSKIISTIHKPNNLATSTNPNACFYSNNGPVPSSLVDVHGDTYLPNVINAKYETVYDVNNKISTYISSTGCNTYKFFPNVCGSSFNWEFKNLTTGIVVSTSVANTPTYSFSITGNYLITLKDNANQFIASTNLNINAPQVPVILGSSTTCTTIGNGSTNNSVVLPQGSTIVWSVTSGVGTISGSNNLSSVDVNWTSLPGTISATVTNAEGCFATTNRVIALDCDDVPVGGCIGDLLFTNTEALPFADYQVSNTIVTSTNYIVNSGSDIQMTAGQFIIFNPNSQINSGSNFIAFIQNCVAQRSTDQEMVKESKVGSKLDVYPNPTKGFVTISARDLKISKVMVTSLEGKVIHTRNNINNYSYELTLENFQMGIYSVIVETVDGEVIVDKIIKN